MPSKRLAVVEGERQASFSREPGIAVDTSVRPPARPALTTVEGMCGPTTRRWRIRRGATLGLVCAGLPLLGHDFGGWDRAAAVAILASLLLVLGIRLASQQLSFLVMSSIMIASQMAVHSLLSVTLDRPSAAEVWTYHAHFDTSIWTSGTPYLIDRLAQNLLLTLAVVLVLYALEHNVWTWFRVAALRLLRPSPSIPPLFPAETPVARTDDVTAVPPPAPAPRAHGRRAPPLPTAA